MFLSRLRLNARHPDARRDLADPYRLHQTLAALGDDRLLFRAEPEAPGGPAVLVQTAAAPDWRTLPAGYATVDGPKPFEPALREGQRVRFRLVANPTVKKRRDGRQGARVPLVHARAPEGHAEVTAGYLDWLDRKLTDAGLAADVDAVTDAPFEVRTRKGGHRVTLFGVRFDGAATVTDPERLAAALREGVGPAKGFGFGLLSLAPA